MLTHLKISHFAIVEELDLDIPGKLTVITGETGAGKSILIDALGLALGDRADAGCVRHGADRADILATFDIRTHADARAWLQERELEAGNDCILRRVIGSDGRSRAYINGTPSPVQTLRELGEKLVSIHGQHEHQALLKKDTHRQLLDEFAGLTPQARALAECYRHWQQKQADFVHFRDHARELQDRADLLRFQLGELNDLKPLAGELAELEQEHRRLANVEGLLDQGRQTLEALSEGEANLLDQARAVGHRLHDMAADDSRLKDVLELVESAAIQLDEAAAGLRHALDTLDMNPERYQDVDQRLSTYIHLARKHREDPHQLPRLWQALQTELDAIDGGDDRLAQREQQAAAARQTFLAAAATLSRSRAKAAKKLGKLITEKVQPLGMPGAEFNVELQPLDPGQASAHGLEQVEFIVRTNPGQPAKPLARIASGGELSRISLAIQVACAAKTNVATLVFDEVDVGIGGGVAQVVGKLLRELGRDNQVLCVTHLPQVAAQGHTHLHVNKQTRRNQTHTDIAALSPDEKVSEIARMLGGLKITEQTLAHAREMLAESQG